MHTLNKHWSRAARAAERRDWHPLVALFALYLIASAIAPAFDI
ncbi:hypothetical protein P355_0158 [Burkholderia cenocepacia KC-01]|nr:hypothetical protein P355_0158 [Burkholderia cenocepacia KC-01]